MVAVAEATRLVKQKGNISTRLIIQDTESGGGFKEVNNTVYDIYTEGVDAKNKQEEGTKVKTKERNTSMRTIVTPKKARIYLEQNTKNRTVNEHRIAYLAKQIKEGLWEYNGHSIKISKDGSLLDGQHRLLAVVRANQSIVTEVIHGLDPKVFDTIDTGKPRTLSHILSIDSVKNAGHCAALARLIFLHIKKSAGTKDAMSNRAGFDIYNEYKDRINYSVKTCLKLREIASVSQLALRHLEAYELNQEQADYFFRKLECGEMLEKGNPILTLRNKLMDIKAKKIHNIPYTLNLVAVAWNAFKEGRTLTRVSTNFEATTLITLV